jgi:hypothetical protein
MRTWNPPPAFADVDPTLPSGGAGENLSAWQRPVRALVGIAESTLVDFELPVPPTLRDLSLGQQRIAAAVLSYLGLTPMAGAMMVELQRERLRAQALRRSDDVETLTAFVRLLLGRPLTTAAEVVDVQGAYQHLRQCHWWPAGPEDLPLAALLVAGSEDAAQRITRIEELHLALSEGDEVPGDPCALVALCASVSDLFDTQVVLRFSALRTELLLSGIPVVEDDITVLPTLATISGDADGVMREFITERGKGLVSLSARASSSAIALAADAVALRHLDGAPRFAFIASLVIRAWMAHRPHSRRPPSWLAGIRS